MQLSDDSQIGSRHMQRTRPPANESPRAERGSIPEEQGSPKTTMDEDITRCQKGMSSLEDTVVDAMTNVTKVGTLFLGKHQG